MKRYIKSSIQDILTGIEVATGDIICITNSDEVEPDTVLQVVDIEYPVRHDKLFTFICRHMDSPEMVELHYDEDEEVGYKAYRPSTFIAELPQAYQDEYARAVRETFSAEPNVEEIVQNVLDGRIVDADDLFADVM